MCMPSEEKCFRPSGVSRMHRLLQPVVAGKTTASEKNFNGEQIGENTTWQVHSCKVDVAAEEFL
jgi:hypothetical protein